MSNNTLIETPFEEWEAIYDQYAAAALQALISKIPLADRDGEFSKEVPQEDVRKLQQDVVNAAHWYATHMICQRQEFIDYLKSNPNP